MSLSLSLQQRLVLRKSLVLRQTLGETIGDIPLYSLHKIKNLLSKKPLPISGQMKEMLLRQLIKANATYKEKSGNDWSCLTSNDLVDAIDGTSFETTEVIEKMAEGQPAEYLKQIAQLKQQCLVLHDEQLLLIKQWFDNNYDVLLYSMDGKVPWCVIQKLRKNLSVWITSSYNPFQEQIEEAIVEIAQEQGIRSNDASYAWKKMGGQLFTK